MSRLSSLRSRLTALQAGRLSVRWGAAIAAIVVAAVIALLGVFALDLAFSLQVLQRVVVMALAVGGIVWAVRKFSLPYLGVKEDLTQLALMVERQHDIDSDLVAALQFEGAGTPARLGSLQLQSAVINYVADALPRIDIFRGFDRSDLLRRAFYAALAIGAAALVAILFPQHTQVFLNRLALGNQHYPTQTHIAEIQVNGRTYLTRAKWDDPLQPKPAACAQGEPVSFRVLISGKQTGSGIVKLVSQGAAAARTSLDLIPAETSPGEAADENGTWYTAELGRLVDGVTYTLQIGDAWTDPAVIDLVPLPVVEPILKTTPPTYAAGTQLAESTTARQLAVLEGTKIDLTVNCTNKSLKACDLKIKTKDGWNAIPMKSDQAGKEWKIAADINPFSPVREELQYELQVVDTDELSLEAPIRGQIRLRPDRPPVVTAGIVHKVVLPTAAPVIDYRATDDFGLSQLKVIVEVERGGAERNHEVAPVEDPSISVAPGELKFKAEKAEVALPKTNELPANGKFALNLAQLKLPKPLEKGDRARLVVVAVDDRGDLPGREAQSEPLLLEISDESGVLSAISEADQQSEERLNEIIRRQLGIGDTR